MSGWLLGRCSVWKLYVFYSLTMALWTRSSSASSNCGNSWLSSKYLATSSSSCSVGVCKPRRRMNKSNRRQAARVIDGHWRRVDEALAGNVCRRQIKYLSSDRNGKTRFPQENIKYYIIRVAGSLCIRICFVINTLLPCNSMNDASWNRFVCDSSKRHWI